MARKYIIAGNWKMNMTPRQTVSIIEEIKPLVSKAECEVMVAVPFVDLPAALDAVEGSNICVAAQNCHWAKSGAFTGEISADMLISMGVGTVIIGHSERRTYFCETDATVNMRVKAALEAGLRVILCVGEQLEQRDRGVTGEVVAMQTKIALCGVSSEEIGRVIIAYEPVWAIGTGRTATASVANEVCALIRSTLSDLYGEQTAQSAVIQYGGSMNVDNASELLSCEHVDGGLIGGASLKPQDFAAIVSAVK